jgi:hypothetical protein
MLCAEMEEALINRFDEFLIENCDLAQKHLWNDLVCFDLLLVVAHCG